MKKLIKKLLVNRILPVFSPSLNGLKLRVNKLIKGSVFLKNYEPDKQIAFELLIKPSGIFFDIGANVGLHSYFIAKKYPSVKIYSFEPLPENIAYMKDIVALNKFENIAIIEAAVSSTAGEAFFDICDNNSMGKLSDLTTSLKVRLVTIDEFTASADVYPDVLKIDVEGAEGEVLKGATKLIEIKQPIFIIELHNPKQDVETSAFLRERDYAVFRLNPLAGQRNEKILLTVAKPGVGWPDPDGVWGNIVAIHNSKLTEYING